MMRYCTLWGCLIASLLAAVASSSVYAKDSKLLSRWDSERFAEMSKQLNNISLDAAGIIERTLDLPATSRETPVTKFIFTPQPDHNAIMIDVIRIDGDIIWVGCMQDPPGVSCSGPCPCE